MDIEKAIKLLTENSYIVERDTDLLGSFERPITDIHLAYTRIVDMMKSRAGKEGVDGQLLCYVMNLGHDKEIPPPKRLLCKEDYDLFLMLTPNEMKELFLRIAPRYEIDMDDTVKAYVKDSDYPVRLSCRKGDAIIRLASVI